MIRTGTLKEVTRVYTTAATYSIRDYLAPANYKVTYIIHQLANRAGFEVESENTNGATVIPLTDTYWLIDNSNPDAVSILKLWVVTSDSFTDEQEESVYNVIGRGRHVDKGEYFGPSGTITLQVRNTGGVSPRKKRLDLLDWQMKNKVIYMRNPFGDVFPISASSMQVERMAGVSTNEFCDVTIPYVQVGL